MPWANKLLWKNPRFLCDKTSYNILFRIARIQLTNIQMLKVTRIFKILSVLDLYTALRSNFQDRVPLKKNPLRCFIRSKDFITILKKVCSLANTNVEKKANIEPHSALCLYFACFKDKCWRTIWSWKIQDFPAYVLVMRIRSAKLMVWQNVSFAPQNRVSVFPFETSKMEVHHAVCFNIWFLLISMLLFEKLQTFLSMGMESLLRMKHLIWFFLR